MKNAAFVDLFPGDAYRALANVVLLGTELGEYSLAGGVAQALIELRPDLPHAVIVLAMNEFVAGRWDDGIARLEESLISFPDSQLCRAILGVCLKIADRSGWQGLLESVIEDDRDESAVGLARVILGYDNTFVPATRGGDADGLGPAPANAMWV